jgi:hypothetical protein
LVDLIPLFYGVAELARKLLLLRDISDADPGFFGPDSGVLLLFSPEAGNSRVLSGPSAPGFLLP